MGQKTNPIGFRLAVRRNWQSRWYANKKDFGKLLAEDQLIRTKLMEKLKPLVFELGLVVEYWLVLELEHIIYNYQNQDLQNLAPLALRILRNYNIHHCKDKPLQRRRCLHLRLRIKLRH